MRLIDADALTEDVLNSFVNANIARDYIKHIQFAPTIEAVPVKHGRWEFKPFYKGTSRGAVECNLCKAAFEGSIGPNYCPNCGADMRGENDAIG